MTWDEITTDLHKIITELNERCPEDCLRTERWPSSDANLCAVCRVYWLTNEAAAQSARLHKLGYLRLPPDRAVAALPES